MARIWNKHKQIYPIRKRAASNGAGTPLKRKVFVALSGGVDSAVSAALLKKQGFRVVAFFMKNWSDSFGLKDSQCPWIQDREDAMRVAAKLDIPFHTLDFEEDYKREVLDYFFREYKAGRTPNPDVMCNSKIKFGVFMEKAFSLGADYVATGHYARKTPSYSPLARGRTVSSPPYQGGVGGGLCQLLKSKDQNKDQTYFLHRLNQAQLSKAMFPIGGYTKPQVRALAKKFGLPNWDKKDSQGLCFVGHVNLKKFLSQKFKEKPGDIITADKKVIGKHKGLFWYTIGQRQGIGVGGIGPFFVVKKDFIKNELIVANNPKDKALYSSEIIFNNVNWIAGIEPKLPLRCQGRIRYREPLVDCRIVKVGDSIARPATLGSLQNDKTVYCAIFSKSVWAAAAGQSIVLHKGEECLGGGVII